MSTLLDPQSIKNLGLHGVIRPAEVDDVLIPDGAVTEAINFHFDRKGVASQRSGMAALGSTVLTSRPCVGLHNAQSGTAISVFSNGGSSTIYSFSNSAWSMSLDGGTASVAIRFIDFGSYTIAINFMYNTYTSMRFWNTGSSRHWHNTGNPINPQNMWGYSPQLGEVYKSKVYLFGDTSPDGNSSRLYFSSVISSTGRITWSPTVDYVDINPGDGEGGTGLKRYSLELLCFKPNYIYRFRTSGVDPDPLIKVGTRSQESIIEGKLGLYFHHDSGIYKYSGGYPTNISRPISDVIAAIPFSQYDDINAWEDGINVYWSIGNITIAETPGNVTWKNVVIRYTESSQVWTIFSYANEIRRGMSYNSGSALSRIVGTDHGVVATFDSGTTDLGEPIKFRIRTKYYEWGGISTRKVLEEFVAICEKSQGAELMFQTDNNYQWETVGQLKKYINHFLNQSIRFHRIRFQLTGMNRSEAILFRGLELLKILNEGVLE